VVEFVKKGTIFRYISEEQKLTVILHFWKMTERETEKPQLRLRHIRLNTHSLKDRIPFHCDIPVFGKIFI
jgi:hypothetical protein